MIKVSYYRLNEHTARRGKGLYPALVLLGIHPRCTPALADNVAQLSAAMASFEVAQGQLALQGVVLSVKTIVSIIYQYAQRVRAAQHVGSLGLGSDVAGRRMVISTDGGHRSNVANGYGDNGVTY